MGALDELRGQLTEQAMSDHGPGVVRGLCMARDLLDAFEAAHPGLRDKTQHCEHCGVPYLGRYWPDGSSGPSMDRESGWQLVETCDRITPDWDLDENEYWLLCPACATEATE